MTVPTWIDSAVSAFGQSAGLGSLSLGERGVAALSFRIDASSAGRLLGYAHPQARLGFRLRAGYLARAGRAVFAVRLADRDVTLPSLNAVFALLWRVALEFGGAA